MSATAPVVATTREHLQKLFRVRQTCIEMLQDRGYLVPSEQKYTSVEEFSTALVSEESGELFIKKEDLTLTGDRGEWNETAHEDLTAEERALERDEWDRDRTVVVFFVAPKEKLGEMTVRQYYQVMVEEGSRRSIIVSPTHPTPQCKRAIAAAEATDSQGSSKVFETFLDSELLINVMKHELVPKHEPLSTRQKNDLLKALRIKEAQLPRLQMADPVARHFGLRRGQVVRVLRPSETAGEYVTYRLVQA
eukprot:TRINITY_DN935_c5_g1_i1.p1 TRINITY_DN935_c5_g1~~TRINITY_DN935_c5_g1_i1.p1  ORF type:complete len:249 (+),score=58.85 TRINITY_DN935_c5_g1_i1:93-839(+)